MTSSDLSDRTGAAKDASQRSAPPEDWGGAPTRVPATIVTGFLGAGKSTLLRRLLAAPGYADTALIVNEFGDVALDHELIDTADETLVETTAGCLCCTVQGDVRRSVCSLIDRAEAGDLPRFSRLIIETTGLADPAPLLHTFMDDSDLRRRAALNGVVTVVDAVNGASTLDQFEEARRQAACADVICVSKADLVDELASKESLEALTARLRALNPGARLIDLTAAPPPPEALFSLAAYDPAGKPPEVLEWLRFEEAQAGAESPHHHHHHHHHGEHGGHPHGANEHDVNRHGDDIVAHCVAFDAPLDSRGFWFALEMLNAYHGQRLLRLKGLVALDDVPDQPVLVHSVQHVLSPPTRLEAWPSGDRRTRLVVIAKGVPAEDIRGVFEMFKAAAPQI